MADAGEYLTPLPEKSAIGPFVEGTFSGTEIWI